MTTPRRGFDVPYGPITGENGEPTQSMAEWMDATSEVFTTLKTAASGMTTLDPSEATVTNVANAWEAFRELLQGIE